MTNLLYQLFTIDNQDPDMVRSFSGRVSLENISIKKELSRCIVLISCPHVAGLIRGSFHSEGNFESSPSYGEVDPKADRKRVTTVLLTKWALFVLKFH